MAGQYASGVDPVYLAVCVVAFGCTWLLRTAIARQAAAALEITARLFRATFRTLVAPESEVRAATERLMQERQEAPRRAAELGPAHPDDLYTCSVLTLKSGDGPLAVVPIVGCARSGDVLAFDQYRAEDWNAEALKNVVCRAFSFPPKHRQAQKCAVVLLEEVVRDAAYRSLGQPAPELLLPLAAELSKLLAPLDVKVAMPRPQPAD